MTTQRQEYTFDVRANVQQAQRALAGLGATARGLRGAFQSWIPAAIGGLGVATLFTDSFARMAAVGGANTTVLYQLRDAAQRLGYTLSADVLRALTPILDQVARAITAFTAWWDTLSEGTQNLIIWGVAAAGAAAVIGKIIGVVASAVTGLIALKTGVITTATSMKVATPVVRGFSLAIRGLISSMLPLLPLLVLGGALVYGLKRSIDDLEDRTVNVGVTTSGDIPGDDTSSGGNTGGGRGGSGRRGGNAGEPKAPEKSWWDKFWDKVLSQPPFFYGDKDYMPHTPSPRQPEPPNPYRDSFKKLWEGIKYAINFGGGSAKGGPGRGPGMMSSGPLPDSIAAMEYPDEVDPSQLPTANSRTFNWRGGRGWRNLFGLTGGKIGSTEGRDDELFYGMSQTGSHGAAGHYAPGSILTEPIRNPAALAEIGQLFREKMAPDPARLDRLDYTTDRGKYLWENMRPANQGMPGFHGPISPNFSGFDYRYQRSYVDGVGTDTAHTPKPKAEISINLSGGLNTAQVINELEMALKQPEVLQRLGLS